MFGFISFLVSIGFMVYVVVSYFTGYPPPGWASLMVVIWLLAGVQLLSLGIIGEYVGKVYSEVKDRPRYIIETTTLSRACEDKND